MGECRLNWGNQGGFDGGNNKERSLEGLVGFYWEEMLAWVWFGDAEKSEYKGRKELLK